MDWGHDSNLYQSRALRLCGQVSLLRVLTGILKGILHCFFCSWGMCDIYAVLTIHCAQLPACLLAGMGICRGCFSFPCVTKQNVGVMEASWEGIWNPFLAPFLAMATFSGALLSSSMDICTENRCWTENTPSWGCQRDKVGKRFIRRCLADFRKWELTISKQKREWDLSVFSVNHSCQRERCQRDVVTKPNV